MSIALSFMSGFANVWVIYRDVLYVEDGCSERTEVSKDFKCSHNHAQAVRFHARASKNRTALEDLHKTCQKTCTAGPHQIESIIGALLKCLCLVILYDMTAVTFEA
jgi:hypothetical protein